MRYLWAVPAAVIGWFVAGFAPSYLAGLPDAATRFVPAANGRVDLLVLGGVAGGVAAGLLLGRVRIAVPLVLVVAGGMWWLSGHTLSARELLITLLAASAVGAFFGALGTRRSVVAAFALTLPLTWYAARPAADLDEFPWLWQLNGLLVAVGLASVLYLSCWRRGWRSAYFWPVLIATYLVSFAVVNGVRTVAAGAGRPTDELADAGTDGFFQAFGPLLRDYWPWMVLAVLLAVPMTALKLRALPPPPPPPDPYSGRSNDAVLSDDLDWIDQPEPDRKLLARRQTVG